MLSDEEREAVEYFKNEIKAFETVITAMKKEIDDKDWLRKSILEIKEDISVRETLLNLIEKQSKEIKEAKQKEKKAYIDGTNVAHELCNKKWKNKIKAKIEIMDTNIVNEEKFDCDYIGQCRFAKYVLQSLL